MNGAIGEIHRAAAYLKDLHRYYGRWYLVTAAYNAGPAIIDKALQSSRASDFWGIKEKAQLSQETRNFVPKFVAVALIATNPKKYGFNNLRYDEPLEFDEVEAEGLLKFTAAAEMAEADHATIKELNPALLRDVTPPGARGYRLRVPVGKGLVFAKAGDYQRSREAEPVQVVTHEVKRGDTCVDRRALWPSGQRTHGAQRDHRAIANRQKLQLFSTGSRSRANLYLRLLISTKSRVGALDKSAWAEPAFGLDR
jgi:hypothetical protein